MKQSCKFNVMFLLSAIFLGLLSCNSQSPQGGDKTFGDISAKEAQMMIEKNLGNEAFVILDTRTPGEYNQGHIENSVFLDYSSRDFYTKVSALDKNKTYLVYCHSGGRSGSTMQYMKKNGFKEAWNMAGGIVGWQKAGNKLVK